ncbi:bifunctional aldolase/short-chain dehydrogenase [Opitutales bacterium]|nr:bifunctional aldolase/short-chain dehydrogenase [Opitutales bacterium]
MKSKWDTKIAEKIKHPLDLRVYSSRLLGSDPTLVLHGGGNTSVKFIEKDPWSKPIELAYIKGSGWDLGNIERAGFSPVKLAELCKMLEFEDLSDSKMVKLLRASMTDPYAPTPSVEAILHGLIPFRFVDHTHADAVVTITNTQKGLQFIKEIYGDEIIIIPYVMPGFILAKEIANLTRELDWHSIKGMILMNHGVFTFSDDAKTSYENMIQLVSKAEAFLKKKKAFNVKSTQKTPIVEPIGIAKIRKTVSEKAGFPMLARLKSDSISNIFAKGKKLNSYSQQGPLTPDHVIRTKRIPAIIEDFVPKGIDQFSNSYITYFKKHASKGLNCLDSAPRWAVLKHTGVLSFGKSVKEVSIIDDISKHTMQSILRAEKLGGWKALSEKDIFEMEYWELEQAKLITQKISPVFQGKVALVTGAASGIGKACVEKLVSQGAVVSAIDISRDIKTCFSSHSVLGIHCDITNQQKVKQAVERTVLEFGGLDLLISNAGSFPRSLSIKDMNSDIWNHSLNCNLTSHQNLLSLTIPYLEEGLEPAVVLVGSKNVPAPGPGASAYSCAKAALTQLGRVAALELGSLGIRINTVHPNAVYDTNLWNQDILKKRAEIYGLSIKSYKKNNVLNTEITSDDVAELVCTILGKPFSKTTGSQVPIDGGNERII